MTFDRFQGLLRGGAAGLADLVRTGWQEDVGLEFKTKARPSTGVMEREDRRKLGRALSGFANAQGGMLVWGVSARRDPETGVDQAVDLQPIAEVSRFRSDMLTAVGEILMPRHDEIFVEQIEATEAAGFVLVYASRSERRPHMSMAPDDRRYYRRAGSSTFPMEHGDIEDAFSRRRVGSLSIVCEQMDWDTIGSERLHARHRAPLRIGLHNDELISARFPYLELKLETGFAGVSDGMGRLVQEQTLRLIEAGPEWHRFAGGADMVVHPAQTLWAAKVNIPVVRSMMDDQIHIAGKPAAETVISVRLRFGALDHPQKTELLELQGQDLEIRLARG